MHGTAGKLRQATEDEILLWQKRVRRASFTRGHEMMWKNMAMVREIAFTGIEPVHMGDMTRDTWMEPATVEDA